MWGNCTGGGKAIFSFLSPQEQSQILSKTNFQSYTNFTIVYVPALLKETKQIISNGYAMDNQEREEGIVCIAAPIFNGDNEPVAAISVSCPSLRMDEDKKRSIISSVLEASKGISKQLGWID